MPPFIILGIFYILVRFSPYYFSLRADAMGDGKLQSFMSYFRYLLALIFATSVLTQLLIFLPIWNSLKERSVKVRILTFLSGCLICFLFAGLIAYAMWDAYSVKHLIKLCLFMTGVQVIYWMLNIGMIYLIEIKNAQTKVLTKEKSTE